MVTLRDDQMRAVEDLRAALGRNNSVLFRGACGFGKTVISAYIARSVFERGKRVIFAVHRRELARQTAVTFERFGIPFGYIMAGKPYNRLHRVQIASVDTLRRHMDRAECDLFIPDEAHLWSGPTRQEVIDAARASGAKIVALTATPRFPGGRDIRRLASEIVHGPTERELIERGHLARYKAYMPSTPDLSGLHVRAGDYVVSELEDRFSKPAIYGDAVNAYRKFADGRRMIGYCYSRKHGGEMAATFTAAGVPAEFIDGETPDGERRAAIGRFAEGETRVLFNAQLFREGFDLSAQVGRDVPIQAVGLYNPTKSLPLAIQMMMRGMRPQSEPSIILDHANILRDHGFPDDEREWTLDFDGSKKKAGPTTVPTVTCGECWGTYRAGPKCCPYCGHTRDVLGREVALIEAEIVEVDPDLVRQARREEQERVNERVRRTRTLPDLARLAIELGRSPGWVFNVYRTRRDGRRDVTFGEVVRAMDNARVAA